MESDPSKYIQLGRAKGRCDRLRLDEGIVCTQDAGGGPIHYGESAGVNITRGPNSKRSCERDDAIKAIVIGPAMDLATLDVVESVLLPDSAKGLSDTLQILLRSFVSGLGYATHGWPIALAMAIMALYSIVAAVFLIQSFVTGISSNAWDSPAEIAALALHSRAPQLGHITAGLSRVFVFREPVSIKENGGEALELVFINREKHNRVLKQVEKNKLY